MSCFGLECSLFLFLFCKDKVTEVPFLVYSNYLVKLLSVLRKEDYGCFAEKYSSLPFIFIMNLVKPSKTQIIWINITIFFSEKVLPSCFLWYTLEHVFLLSLKHIYCSYSFLFLYLHMVWIQRDCCIMVLQHVWRPRYGIQISAT